MNQQGTRIQNKKYEDNQNLLPRQQPYSLESSAREHHLIDPNQQPRVIEKTAADSQVRLSVFNKGRESDQKPKDEVDHVIRSSCRLEEIILSVSQEEQPKLSQEQLRVNNRLQEEEILAMGAIYGENFIQLDRQDGLRYFQINIHIDVSDKLIVYTGPFDGEIKFGGIYSEAMATADDNSNGFFYSTFKVQYLPPIVLTCLLPNAYPSHGAPFFTISVQWLDAMRISSLCQMLDTIWTDQSGQEIVYPWVDWLCNSSLSHLEFDNNIGTPLGKAADNAAVDRRAISESVSLDVDIRSILNYNEDKLNEGFCQNLQECCICLSDHPGTSFVRLPCKHFFCRNCMETYSTIHAKEGVAILCPQIKCRELVPPGLVKSLLGDERFEKWESLLFQKTLDTMSDIVYCPRCDMACLEDEDHLAECPRCFFTFCGLCGNRLHVGVPCMTLEVKLRFLQITHPVQKRQTGMNKEERRKQLDEINKSLNMEEIMHIAKRCPKCRVGISRSYGCNHMRCVNCSESFCYKCGKAYENLKPLCCGYFDMDPETISQQEQERQADELSRKRRQEAQRQQEQEEQRQFQLPIKDPASRAHPCPSCRQMNPKVDNNNHILCWYCQKHHCYLCRKMVTRSSQHYGPKGCKQHSAG
ncbi:E3 ubiquitin-protein ligase RNF14-like [Papaver somniferum]|uniref:E3 ubiquitin-protein ligase RNF14-like n=1 Tax=Papaver somniferum TaxID=3469 RepID=UPI000E70046F|nr:E3 ubiquitin-protein ligase RNF14-like [Papaver somniferum]